ncbi:MAG: transglutaminase domain-containing protein [Spirosomataceae bacterium]
MKLQVEHQLLYRYSNEVFLSPHYIYLTPKTSPHQILNDYWLEISPKPNLLFKNTDAEGNTQQIAYFNQSCNLLLIKSSFVIISDEHNPYNFVHFPFESEKIPFEYPEKEHILLSTYLTSEGITTAIHQFVRPIAAEANWKTMDFLVLLCTKIKENFRYEVRPEGEPNKPEKTLLIKSGSCRDYAVLMIACCKALGIAARFVSGYCYGSELHAHELHAWVEAYLPGGGWRGFDPTEGVIVDHQYIALASSAQPELINPVTGTFRGAAISTLEPTVNINRL